MAFGNNRAAARPRSSFQVAGGTTIKFRHPFLSGQISGASPVDEIDVSRALRLNDTFFNAAPAQDSSFQEPLVDGSVITITNHLLAGSAALTVLQTTGFVGSGDFVAALQLIKSTKDDIGGTLTVIQNMQGKRRVTIFYGVSVKHLPDLIIAGNAVVPYPVTLLYAGWVQGVSGNSAVNEKTIWAVGNKYGLKAVYKPYAIQDAENQGNFYGGQPLQTISGLDAGDNDDPSGDNVGIVPTVVPPGGYPSADPSATAPNPTWP